MIDRSRGQLIGEELINKMKIGFPAQAQDRTVMMVGFTRGDMYVRHKNCDLPLPLARTAAL